MGVKINGLDSLRQKVNALPGIVKKAQKDALQEATELTASRAAENIQAKHPTGELAGSIKTDVMEKDDSFIGYVWSDKVQAVYREFGTGPNGEASIKDLPEGVTPTYTQTPWFIPIEKVDVDLNELYSIPIVTIKGKKFYRTSGQIARPWLYPALKDVMPDLPDIFKKHVQDELKKGLK